MSLSERERDSGPVRRKRRATPRLRSFLVDFNDLFVPKIKLREHEREGSSEQVTLKGPGDRHDDARVPTVTQ